MIFAKPLLLFLIPLAPAAYIAKYFYYKNRRRSLTLPMDFWGAEPGPGAVLFWRFIVFASTVLFCLSWTALCLVAAKPIAGKAAASYSNTDSLMMFVLDLSPSMAARDVDPSRLEAAKSLIKNFIASENGAKGARIGISAFGADTALVCPPTRDYALLLDRLEELKPGMLGDGTAIGLGLNSAVKLLQNSKAKKTALVLLSDGEDNVGLVHPLDTAEMIAASGINFFVIGLGTKGEVPIEYKDPVSGQELRGIYRSSFDTAVLSALADRGKGLFRLAQDKDILASLGQELAKLADIQSPEKLVLSYSILDSNSKPFFLASIIFAALACLLKLAAGGLL